HTRSKRDWSSDVCSSDLIEEKVSPSAKCGRNSLMQLGVLYQAGQGAIMHGDDPAAAEEQVQLGGFDLPLLLAQQWMNGHVDVIRSEERRVGKECGYREEG